MLVKIIQKQYKKVLFDQAGLWLLIISMFCLFQISVSHAATGDELMVIESVVNVRTGPSTENESIIKLQKNRKVTEIQRQNNWVEIETHRDDIKTGWIHQSLLTKVDASRNTSSPSRFDIFMQRFNDHNEVIEKQNGTLYFTEVINKGKNEIELVATQDWINGDIEMRNNTLGVIFKWWSEVVPVGSSISVQVVDEQGERYTVMLR